jgi:hypothetical protein
MTSSEIQQFLLVMDVGRGRTEVRDLGTDYAAAVVGTRPLRPSTAAIPTTTSFSWDPILSRRSS